MRFKFLFPAIGLVFISAGLAFAYNIEDYYPLSEGNSWTYSATLNENGQIESYERTVKVDGTEIIRDKEITRLISREDLSQCLLIDSEGVKKFKVFSEDDYEVFNPELVIFPAGLDIGQTKEQTLNSEITMHQKGNVENVESTGVGAGKTEVTLDSIEDVEVPGGKFSDCLKFSSVVTRKDFHSSEEGKCTTWLASGVGIVKESCNIVEKNLESGAESVMNKEFELISASVGGKIIGNQ